MTQIITFKKQNTVIGYRTEKGVSIGFKDADYIYTENSDVAVLINSIIDASTTEALTIFIKNAPVGKFYTFNSFIRDKYISGEFNQHLKIVGESKLGARFKAQSGYSDSFFETQNWARLIDTNQTRIRGGSDNFEIDDIYIVYSHLGYLSASQAVDYYTPNQIAELQNLKGVFKIFGPSPKIGHGVTVDKAPEVAYILAYPSGDWALAPSMTEAQQNLVESEIKGSAMRYGTGGYLIWGTHDSFLKNAKLFSFSPNKKFHIKVDTGSGFTGGSLQIRDIHTYGGASTPNLILSATCSVMHSELEGGSIIINSSENRLIDNYIYYVNGAGIIIRSNGNTLNNEFNKVSDTITGDFVQIGDVANGNVGVSNNNITIRGNILSTSTSKRYINYDRSFGGNRVFIQSYKAKDNLVQADIWGGTANATDFQDIFVTGNAGSPFNIWNRVTIPSIIDRTYSQAQTVTVSNTTTETNLIATPNKGGLVLSNNLVLQADTLVLGNVLNINAKGIISSASGTVNIRLRFINSGTVLMVDSGAITLPALTNAGFEIDLSCNVRNIGASGLITTQGKLMIQDATYDKIYSINNTGSVGIATNVNNTVNLTAQWSVASASNSLQCRLLTANLV